ncbi:MAG: hypothetical protein KBT11_05360 [Treponema sp.]|nr:hypothetical protein [Candidatus Treponema equifaecale]
MKKLSLLALTACAFIFFSCGSTANVANQDESALNTETAETESSKAPATDSPEMKELDQSNPLTHIIEQNASLDKTSPLDVSSGAIITVENTNTQNNSVQAELETEKNETADSTDEASSDDTSMVDNEDQNFNKDADKAPTTDESSKVSEPNIFEEPEVKDLIEIEPELPAEVVVEPEVVVEAQKEETKPAAVPLPEAKEETPENSEQNNLISEETEAEPLEESGEAIEKKPEIVPSRSVTMKKNQYLDVAYPGKGWTYIGEEENLDLIKYFGRRVGAGNTNFTLRSSKSGKTILHFYKNDGLTEDYIDDYLEVIILDEIAKNNNHAKAPSYAEIVPAKPVRKFPEQKPVQKAEQATLEKQVSPEPAAPAKAESADKKTENRTSEQTAAVQKSQNQNQDAAQKNEKTEASDDVKTVISTPQEIQNPTEPLVNSSATPVSSVSSNSEFSTDTQPGIQTEPEVTVSSEEDSTDYADESLLEKAKQLYNEKKYEEAAKCAKNYSNAADSRLDEAYFLLGQIYEADSPVKNIRNSVDAYTTVTKRYKQSKLWKEANQRSIYLKRFYIDIR